MLTHVRHVLTIVFLCSAINAATADPPVLPGGPPSAPVSPVAPVAGAPKVTLPKDMTVPLNRATILEIDYVGKEIDLTWVGELDPTDKKLVQIERLHDTTPGKIRLIVIGYTKGQLWLTGVASGDDGKLAKGIPCHFTIEGPAPAPPEPDTLTATLKALYDPTQQDDVLRLASVYRVAAQTPGGTLDAPSLKTNDDVASTLSTAANSRVPLPRLQTIREAIRDQVIIKLFPDKTAVLDNALRAKWREQCLRIAAALTSIASVPG